MNSTRKRMIIMLLVVGVVGGLLVGFQIFKGMMIKKFMAAGQPPQTVSTTVAKYQDWQPSISAVGSLRAVRGSDLAFEVAGIVDTINFQSGDDVQQGTMLARLRAQDDEAHLASLAAAADLARTTYARDQRQYDAKAISKAQLDIDSSNVKTSEAAVVEQRATLDKKIMKAPFSGRMGVRQVDLGQYLNPGTAVVTLQALDPIYADFYLPSQQIGLISVGEKVSVKIDPEASQSLEGEISAINPKVDATTRDVLVRATLHNTDHHLLPGASVSVEIPSGQMQRYLTLPQTAVTFNPYGDTVFLVVDDGKDPQGKPKLQAKQAVVVTGPTRGDQVAVLDGLKENETVVSAGQLKIQNGAFVVVNNSVQPTDNPKPKPVDQ